MSLLSRDFIVKGTGKMIARNISDGLDAGYLGSLGDMSVTLSFPRNKVYGGNGQWSIGSVQGDVSGTISFTNNKFNLDMLSMIAGALVARGASITAIAIDEPGIIPLSLYSLTFQPAYKYTDVYSIKVSNRATALATQELAKTKVRFADHSPLVYVASSPSAGEYSYASGIFTFSESDKGKAVYIDYLYLAIGDAGSILPTSVSVPIEIYHKGVFVDDETGETMGLQIYAPNLLASGELSFDRKRGTASTHKLAFDIIDPQTGASVIEFSSYLV